MKTLTTIPVILLIFILIACGNKVPQEQDQGREVQVVTDFENYQNSAPVNFESVTLKDDILILKFNFSKKTYLKIFQKNNMKHGISKKMNFYIL